MTTLQRASEVLGFTTQVLFALSPIPAYLPQYLTLVRSDDPRGGSVEDDDATSASSSPTREDHATAQRRKRHMSDDRVNLLAQHDSIDSSSSTSAGSDSSDGDVGGMSPLSVLILLAAHFLRLFYFYGVYQLSKGMYAPPPVLVVRNRNEADVAAMFDGANGKGRLPSEGDLSSLNELTALEATEIIDGEETGEGIQYDLVAQSMSMIAVQLLLVHGMSRIRRRRRKRAAEENRLAMNPLVESARWDDDGTDCIPRPPPKSVPNRALRRVAHLLAPRRIWRYDTLWEHVECLSIFALFLLVYCDFYLFPRYHRAGVNWVRNASIVLESCLALPQMIQNYARGETGGLSVIMVGGWVSGDFLKLCYFLLGMIRQQLPDPNTAVSGVTNPADVDNSNAVFAAGCLLAITLDVIVGMQMVLWYPTPGVVEMRDSLQRSIRHFRANKDDDGGASLLNHDQRLLGRLVRTVGGIFKKVKETERRISSPSKSRQEIGHPQENGYL